MIFNDILERGEVHEQWRGNITYIDIFKGKRDALKCGKYKEVRLLEHSKKVCENIKILQNRMKRTTET